MAGKALRKKRSYVETAINPGVGNSDSDTPKKVYKCVCCGSERTRPNGSFPLTRSPLFAGNDGYAPVCWSCVNKYYERMVNFFNGNETLAGDHVCSVLDLYFNADAFNSTTVRGQTTRMKLYMSRLNQLQYEGKTYLETYLDRNASAILSDTDSFATGTNVDTVRKWGFGFEPDQYAMLDAEYADWEARCVIDSKSREKLVRDMCVITLKQQTALHEGNIDTYKSLTELYQKTLDRAELSPKIVASKDKGNEKPIGVMIKMFEEERPISEPRPEWKDVDGIMKLILVYFIGHLCKMLNLRNKYAKMYEDEMDKYRVTVPELEDAETEEVFDYLLENGGIELGGAADEPSK